MLAADSLTMRAKETGVFDAADLEAEVSALIETAQPRIMEEEAVFLPPFDENRPTLDPLAFQPGESGDHVKFRRAVQATQEGNLREASDLLQEAIDGYNGRGDLRHKALAEAHRLALRLKVERAAVQANDIRPLAQRFMELSELKLAALLYEQLRYALLATPAYSNPYGRYLADATVLAGAADAARLGGIFYTQIRRDEFEAWRTLAGAAMVRCQADTKSASTAGTAAAIALGAAEKLLTYNASTSGLLCRDIARLADTLYPRRDTDSQEAWTAAAGNLRDVAVALRKIGGTVRSQNIKLDRDLRVLANAIFVRQALALFSAASISHDEGLRESASNIMMGLRRGAAILVGDSTFEALSRTALFLDSKRRLYESANVQETIAIYFIKRAGIEHDDGIDFDHQTGVHFYEAAKGYFQYHLSPESEERTSEKGTAALAKALKTSECALATLNKDSAEFVECLRLRARILARDNRIAEAIQACLDLTAASTARGDRESAAWTRSMLQSLKRKKSPPLAPTIA